MKRNFYKKNQLLQLKGFCALIEEKTIQKAAKKIGTVHSNISLQIKALERDLDLKLFEKKGKNLIPNEYALDFYQSAKKMTSEIEDLFNVRGKVLRDRNEDLIRIAGHSYSFSHLLPKYFKQLIDKNPKVKFELHNIKIEEGVDLLNKNLVDLIAFPLTEDFYIKDCYRIIDFHQTEFYIVYQKDHPIATKNEEMELKMTDLLKYDFCTLANESSSGYIKNHIFSTKFKLINGSWDIIGGLIRHNLTISLADLTYLKDRNWADKIRMNLFPNFKFSCCFKANYFRNNNIRLFHDILEENRI